MKTNSLVLAGMGLLLGGAFQAQAQLPAATFSLQADTLMSSSPGTISFGDPTAIASIVNGPNLFAAIEPVGPTLVHPLSFAPTSLASASETFDFEITGGTGAVTALLNANSTTTVGANSSLTISQNGTTVYSTGASGGSSFSDQNFVLSLQGDTLYSVTLSVLADSIGSAELDPPIISLPAPNNLNGGLNVLFSPNYNPPGTVPDSYSTLGLLGSVMGLFGFARAKFLARKSS